VLGTPAQRRGVDRFVQSVTPLVQRHVAGLLRIRVAPKIAFTYDDSIEKQDSVSKLIDRALASDRRRDGATAHNDE
jgi:ribosome-binding factor A